MTHSIHIPAILAKAALALALTTGVCAEAGAQEIGGGYTLTLTVTAPAVTYLDADGNEQTTTDYTILTGSETSLAAGTYLVASDITYDHTVTLSGNVNLILKDGCTMNVGTSSSRISGNAIDGNYAMTIYGQTAQTGTLSVYVSGDYWNAIGPRNLTINGGNVIANAEGKGANGLKANGGGTITINRGNVNATATGSSARGIASQGNVEINGGTVNASGAIGIKSDNAVTINGGTISATGGSGSAINCNGNYTFSWRTPADRITIGATGLYATAAKTATFTRLFTDGTTTYSTSLTGSELNALSGVTLYPYIENLSLAANAHDGNFWTTFYCGHTGYKIDDGENAWAYTATVSGNELTLHKLGKVIPKQTAVILVGSDNSISMTASTDAAEYDVENDLRGEDVRTSLDDIKTARSITDGTFYVMGKVGDNFGFYQYTAQYMPARKAYLLVSGSAPEFLGFDEDATGIRPLSISPKGENTEASLWGGLVGVWYTLSGTRLNAQPTQKGVYIHGNKKIVIK